MEVQQIPIGRIKPSPMNPRKIFAQEDLQELAQNIKEQGLLQPITVRPSDYLDEVDNETGEVVSVPTGYEIVCGERRYRAMMIIADGNEDYEVPSIVRVLDDTEAYEAMITENLQRKDIDPMEEAFAFNELIKVGKTAEEIALRFGKPLRFVQQRVKLATLIPEAKEMVTNGKMDIGCAQIICKLSEEDQRNFMKRQEKYGGYSKYYAERFTDDLFQIIENADFTEDFTGGCGCTCEKCQYNSANAGCLFYEMKGNAKCTSKDKFKSKNEAWYHSIIDKERGNLLLEDDEFIQDKTCIVVDDRYNDGKFDEFLKPYRDANFKIVDKEAMFEWHGLDETDEDDQEEIAELKANMTGYRCVVVGSYYGGRLQVEIQWLAFKPDPKEVDPNEVEARDLAAKRFSLLRQRKDAVTSALAGVIAECDKKNDKGHLFGIEQKALCALLLKELPYAERAELGVVTHEGKDDLVIAEKNMKSNSDSFLNMIVRRYIVSELNKSYNTIQSKPKLLDMIARGWYPAKASEAITKAEHKFEKRLKDLESKLDALGYDAEGKKKPTEAPKRPSKDKALPIIQFKEMKKKHPDALLLMRVGDFYESYDEDAVAAAEILGITLSTIGGVKMTAFPHHSLDTYLPKLTRAGKRVAICDQLDEPKSKK